MSKILNESLIYEILSVVEEIPEGRVASYGQIARLIGEEGIAFKENGCVDMKQFQWQQS